MNDIARSSPIATCRPGQPSRPIDRLVAAAAAGLIVVAPRSALLAVEMLGPTGIAGQRATPGDRVTARDHRGAGS